MEMLAIKTTFVAPHAGAWVETGMSTLPLTWQNVAPWRGVGRNFDDLCEDYIVFRSPLRGGVGRNPAEVEEGVAPPGRPPRGVWVETIGEHCIYKKQPNYHPKA